MADLAQRGPLGQKPAKAAKKPRKPLAKVSARKAAKRRQEAAEGARDHMARVAALPCLVCGYWPVEVHHDGHPRSDWNVLPLCPRHHRREFGEGAYHYSPQAFYAAHGSSQDLLNRVSKLVK